MAEHDHVLNSETEEPTAVSNTTSGVPPHSGGRRKKSNVWNHFTVEPDSVDKDKCNYCHRILKYNYGTSSMSTHVKKFQSNPNSEVNKRRKSTSSSTANVASPSLAKFDQHRCRNSLVKMVMAMELPVMHVEHKAFREFMSVVQPRFGPISRSTLTRDALSLWDTEKTKLKNFLSQHCRSVCLTTDTWNSCQNVSYMCITAHFIDNDWTLQKRILNFLHMRCCAHILNLIVNDGLKEIDDYVLRIRVVVKYVKSSPSRLLKFNSCVENSNIEYKGGVVLDVETRWNSTYDMLKTTLKLEKAFVEPEITETKYREELKRGKSVPTSLDWQNAREISKFLKFFEEATLRISGSSCVTSNMYMAEVFAIGLTIKQMCQSTDANLSTKEMAKRMKKKYDKYWGNLGSINMLLLISFVLDPRYKLKYPSWFIDQNFNSLEANELKKKIESCLNAIFQEFRGGVVEGSQGDSQSTQFVGHGNDPNYFFTQFLRSTGVNSSSSKSELNKYLGEDLEDGQSPDFDILNWWKVNSSRFPILGNIAREVLAIPASTVPSESAFSTGGRVLDQYRSCLTPKSVEALICTQDWLRGSPSPLPLKEDIEEFEKFHQEIVSPQDGGASSTYVTLDED